MDPNNIWHWNSAQDNKYRSFVRYVDCVEIHHFFQFLIYSTFFLIITIIDFAMIIIIVLFI